MCYNEITMNTLTLLAQSSTLYDYSVSSSTSTPTNSEVAAAGLLAFIFFMGFFLLVFIITYVVNALLLGQIFKKAGAPTWAAWVPVYNNWKFLEIGGQQGFWAVLAFVPIVGVVSLVFSYIAAYHIGKSLGKSDAFVLFAIFLPIVWLIWLAVDKSTWNSKATA